jgi:acetyl esterase/lipase
MKRTFSAILLALAVSMSTITATAQTYEIALWPDGAAESNGITAREERRADGGVYNVSEAAIYVWPAEGESTRRAILLCPGGSYAMQAARHEGSQFAEWFASQGITAVVLKYRLPNGHSEIPLADTQQAMLVIRKNAGEWGVDPAQVGVAGFSAGGHLASTLLTHFDEGSRPDFGILFYPVVTMGEATHGGSRENLLGKNPSSELVARFSNELQVTADTPPTLIFYSDDDLVVPPVNGSMFYGALKAAGVPAAMYFFPSGGHGWGFNRDFKYHEAMKAATLDWLSEL